jgi:hypothetical protein
MTTWGDEDDFRHFLPRLLELWADDSISLLLPDSLINKLQFAGWSNWPKEEREVIMAFLVALWKDRLLSDISTDRLSDYFYAIANAARDLTPYLEAWRELSRESHAAVYHIAHFVIWHDGYIYSGDLFQWDNQLIAARQVVEWLKGEETLLALERAFYAEQDPTIAEELSRAVKVIETLRIAKT